LRKPNYRQQKQQKENARKVRAQQKADRKQARGPEDAAAEGTGETPAPAAQVDGASNP
jgi:hypothetical protein